MEKAAKQPWLKPLVFAAALSPLLWLVSRAVRGTLGPDPVAEVLNRLGLYAITLLFCSLACTPLQIVLGWSWPLRVRRMPHAQFVEHLATITLGVISGTAEMLGITMDPDRPIRDVMPHKSAAS